jgi:hypothetical protein
MWYALLTKILLNIGFTRSKYEPCCFIRDINGTIDDKFVIISVYVDDRLITGPNKDTVEGAVKNKLGETSRKIKDLEDVKKYLGLKKVDRRYRQILLNQTEYIEEIVEQFGKEKKIRPRNTPLPRDLVCLCAEAEAENGKIQQPIQDILGKIRYLADRNRPDLIFATCFIARFAALPKEAHVDAVYKTVGYLEKTKNLNLHVGSASGQIELLQCPMHLLFGPMILKLNLI